MIIIKYLPGDQTSDSVTDEVITNPVPGSLSKNKACIFLQ